MEGSGDYLIQLDSALEQRHRWIDTTDLPRLKDAVSSYETLFDGAMQMLIRKGLLREDPYNYEQAFTDIVLPSDEMLPEFENSDELSYRLAGYQRQLRFLAAEYPLDLKSLNLARLKKISSLMSYINWSEFTEAAKSPTTRAFVHAFVKVRMGSDTMAAQILKDSEGQISKVVNVIRVSVGGLIAYYRESWKSELRHNVIPDITLSATDTGLKKDEMLRAIRHGFAQKMMGKPWYPALAEEVAMEELAPDGPQRKQKALASLAIPADAPKTQPVVAQDPRAVLLDAVKLICRPHEELATAIAVLEENEKLLAENKPSGGWLRRLFRGGGNGQGAEERSYKVQWTEPGSPTPKTETVDMASFAGEVEKKTSLMAALFVSSGPAYRKLAGAPESTLAAFVDKQLNELVVMHRRLECLNSLFQARATLARKQTRGIKIELLTIKNSIVKANQKRHDYVGSGAS